MSVIRQSKEIVEYHLALITCWFRGTLLVLTINNLVPDPEAPSTPDRCEIFSKLIVSFCFWLSLFFFCAEFFIRFRFRWKINTKHNYKAECKPFGLHNQLLKYHVLDRYNICIIECMVLGASIASSEEVVIPTWSLHDRHMNRR